MKIKSDFVTNSSSSSFVIAYKDEITLENIEKAFGKGINEALKNKDVLGWLFGETNISYKDAYNQTISELMSLFQEEDNLQLGEWKVFSREFSDEDQDIVSYLFYDGLNSETSQFKIKAFC